MADRQRTLLRYLETLDAKRKEKVPELAPIYLGALEALHTKNTDRFALAAHNIREMIGFLPHALLDEVWALEDKMSNHVNSLTDRWQRTAKNSKSLKDGRWSGDIDASLKKFLRKAGEFFHWAQGHGEARERETAEALYRLDASDRQLPEALAKRNYEYLQGLADFFVKVCHHGRPTTDEEFAKKLEELETFFVQRMQPMTFERTRDLKALIEGG